MSTSGSNQTNKVISPPKEFFRQFSNLAHNRVLNEDFPHEKLFTAKYKGTGSDFVVAAKGSFNIKTDIKTAKEIVDGKTVEKVVDIKDSYPTSSEVKLLTAYNGTSTEARFNNKGIVKLWTNWGVYKVGEPLEVVSVLKGDTAFNKTKGWVGAYYTKGAIGSATRFQARRDKAFSFSLAQKLTYSKKDIWGGAYVDFNLTDLKLTQYNAIVGYNVNKNIHFYLEHTTGKPGEKPVGKAKTVEIVTTATEKTTITTLPDGGVKEQTVQEVEKKIEEPLLKRIGFGKATLTGAYKDNKFHALAQLGWNEPTEVFTVDAGVVYTINANSSVRAKVNQDFNLAIGGRHKFNKNISLNIGLSAPLADFDKFYDSRKTVPIPFGSSLEFNF